MTTRYALAVLFGLALTTAGAAFAAPAPHEVVAVNVNFNVSKCVYDDPNAPACDSTASTGTNVDITLDQCSGDSSNWTTCMGQWQLVGERDGYQFDATITVSKTTYPNETPTYSLIASAGPTLNSHAPQSVQVTLSARGTLDNAVQLTGETLSITGTGGAVASSYTPSLTVGPRASSDRSGDIRDEKFGGIGVVVELNKDGLIEIREVLKNLPGERAGLAVGDVIRAVQANPNAALVSTAGKSLEEVVALVRGETGTQVKLVLTEGSGMRREFSVTLVREDVTPPHTN